jgi:hypothetical protein
MRYLKLLFVTIFLLLNNFLGMAQFPPAAGLPGSTAVHRDTSIIVNWAKQCAINVGYIHVADTTIYYAGSNKANYGTAIDGIDKADDHVVSLGDGGEAILSFDPPIRNGNGFDFAVFENGLNDNFLELAFVEVSSDSIRFVRFPATSLTQDTIQVPTFGYIEPTQINNLAGKYRVLFGTPFDLDDLKDSTAIDLLHIRYVRITDVIGTMDPRYTRYDAFGHKINDPWPTPWNTGGYDLDGVGVIHENLQSLSGYNADIVKIYPNPFKEKVKVRLPAGTIAKMEIRNLEGQRICSQDPICDSSLLDLSSLSSGIFIIYFWFDDGSLVVRKIIKI